MIIIIDSREQRPFQFSDQVQTEVSALHVGDYSIRGLEDQITIERKSLGDLLGSITSGRERFKKKLRQLRAFRLAVLMVEANWTEVMSGLWPHPSKVHPNAVVGSLVAFTAKYGVVPILAEDHATASRLTERILMNFARIVERDYKSMTK